MFINTFKYHVFAPMGRFQLELIYLYGRTVENKGKLIVTMFIVDINDEGGNNLQGHISLLE